MKKAFLTGVSGQDGSYLAELLLEKNYEVHAILRRASVFTSQRIDHLSKNPNFYTYYGDLVDSSNLHSLLSKIDPHEVYNLGAQSHVAVSFEVPEYTAEVDALGTIRLLDAIKNLNQSPRFYQASTSELFGGIPGTEPQNEATPFYPKSPYGVAKLYSYWVAKNYRESYGLFTSNGILFNHESPRRGATFVTKKITKSAANYHKGHKDILYLGNLDAKRDWGYAKDYVESMWLMLQHDEPDDFVIATGKSYTVREFFEMAYRVIGVEIEWVGLGANEVGIDKKDGNIITKVDSRYYRPSEVEILRGDPSKAASKLGWKPKTDILKLVEIMVNYDLKYKDYGHPDL